MATFQYWDGSTIELDILVEPRDDLIILPAGIDPHVHFRTPGMEYKEDWRTAAKATIAGGYTTVFDMPNTLPPTNTLDRLIDKKKIIDAQLAEVGIPLHYDLFFGADKHHLDQIPLIKDDVIGIKVFMGCSTGNLVIDDDESLHAIFEIAAKHQLLVAVHAEDEHILNANKKAALGPLNYADHSKIRSIEAAQVAVEKAISLTRLYGTRLYILHVSTAEEIQLIKQAKTENLPVFAETTPHHLFLNDQCYASLQGRAVVNPPLRPAHHTEILFEAINQGIIDTIGSDHAPHTLAEKGQAYGQCPSGMPGIETTFPLLFTALHQKLLTLAQIVSLTSHRAREIFSLPPNQDYVGIYLKKVKIVEKKFLRTKCAWSAFEGQKLTGWPGFTLLNNQLYRVEQ